MTESVMIENSVKTSSKWPTIENNNEYLMANTETGLKI
jgi:hypothetical protein